MPELSIESKETIEKAIAEARVRLHEYASLEHLLFAMLENKSVAEAIKETGGNVEELRTVVRQFIDQEYSSLVNSEGKEPEPTAGFQRVVQRAVLHVQAKGDSVVEGVNLLIALYSERDSYAVYFLQQQGVSRLDVVSWVSHGISKVNVSAPAEPKPDLERDFFISYSSENEDSAREIDGVVRALGYSTVVQFRDFSPGSNFVVEMQNALQNSLRLIAVYSPGYFVSSHCQAEWNAAYNADPKGLARKILPFLVEQTKLPPLASEIVFTSLVGMTRKERARAIYRALSGEESSNTFRGVRSLEELLDRTVSPDVSHKSGKLSISYNEEIDEVIDFPALMESGLHAEEVGRVIVDSLPHNTPPVVRFSLIRYCEHISENRRRPISGILVALSIAIEREKSSVDFEFWGEGLESLLSSFLENHARLIGALKGSSEREQAVKAVSIASESLDRREVVKLVEEGQEALESLIEEENVDNDFKGFVGQQREILSSSDLADVGSSSLKRNVFARFVLGSMGFYKKVSEVIAANISIFSSPAFAKALEVLKDVSRRMLEYFG